MSNLLLKRTPTAFFCLAAASHSAMYLKALRATQALQAPSFCSNYLSLIIKPSLEGGALNHRYVSFHSSPVSLIFSGTGQWYDVIMLQMARGARTSMMTRHVSSSIIIGEFVMLRVFSDRTYESSATPLHINQKNAKEAVLVGRGRVHKAGMPVSACEVQCTFVCG